MPATDEPGGTGKALAAGRFGHKYGPLPLWAWAGLFLGGALAVSTWRRNKAAKNAAAQQTQAQTYPPDQTPPYVVINDLWTGTTTTPAPVPSPPVSGNGSGTGDKDHDDDDHHRRHRPPVPAPTPTPQPVPEPAPVPDRIGPGVYTPPQIASQLTENGGSFLPFLAAAPAPTVPAPAPVVRAPSRVAYKVQPGDTLSKIASTFGVFGGNGFDLYNYNVNSAGRSAQDVAVLKQRGPNLIYAGETIYIPR